MIAVLHRDDDCMAVFKPCGVTSVPTQSGDTECLSALLSEQVGSRVYPVHRLDKEVSGVILYALSAEAQRFFNNAFEFRHVHKTYLAVVHGAMQLAQDVIARPLRICGSGRTKVDDVRGRPSETRYEVVQKNDLFSLVSLHPVTGRRHQLRAHLYSIGHSIVGDTRYGPAALRNEIHPRIMLTSIGLSLQLPSGGTLCLRDIVPADFREAAEQAYGLTPPPRSADAPATN
jgi:RluA family pseudouridine synthase